MLKIIFSILLTFLTFSTVQANADTVTVFSYDGQNNESSVSVPKRASRVAVIDVAALDIIDSLGLSENVVAIPKAAPVPYLKKYFTDKNIHNIGTLKEVDIEELLDSKVDLIIIGGRLASKYNELSAIAPVLYIHVNYNKPILESIEQNAKAIASIYDKADLVNDYIDSFKSRIDAIKEKATGKTAVVGLVSSSHFRTLGNNARLNMIGKDLGFNNLAAEVNINHGSESSFEFLVKTNPDYLFVLDRDSAISRPGAKIAKDTLENELVKKTDAYKNNRIIYLNPQAWYLGEGGLMSMDLMLSDIEKSL